MSAATSLEEITNKVFEDLMHGKSESAQPLANTGLNIHEPKNSQVRLNLPVHVCTL